MSNVIHIDFLRAKRRKQLTVQAGRATVKGPLAKEKVSGIKASIERITKMLEVLKSETRTKQDRK